MGLDGIHHPGEDIALLLPAGLDGTQHALHESAPAGRLRPELQLDLLQAVAGHTTRRIMESLNRYQAGLAKNDALAIYRPLLSGAMR